MATSHDWCLLASLAASLAAACSSSSDKRGPDAQADLALGTDVGDTPSDSADANLEPPGSDTSIAALDAGVPPDSTVLDGGSEASGGPLLQLTPPLALLVAPCAGQSSAPVHFQVANAGDTASAVTVKITGSKAEDFVATATGCDVLAPGAVCTIDVVFTNSTGLREDATLEVSSGSSVATAVLTNAMLGGPASLTLASFSPEFGSVAIGKTGPFVAIEVSFNGRRCSAGDSGPLTVSMSGSEFVIADDTCSAKALPIGASCTFAVAFRPMSPGPKSEVLSVTGPDLVLSVPLSGTGVASPMDGGVESRIDSGNFDAGAVDGGINADRPLQLGAT